MSFFRSIRFRLTCWYSGILAAVLVTFGVVLYGAVRYQSIHHHDDSLRAAARAVTAILAREPDCATLTSSQIADLQRLERLVLIHELAGGGQVFYRSPDLEEELLPRSEGAFRKLLSEMESFETLERPAGAMRVYSVRYTSRAGRQGVVRVVDSLGDFQEALATLRLALFLMIPGSLLAAAVGGYWLAGRALRPVDELTRLAREIEATNLGRRLPVRQAEDELGRLVSTFNQMIGRLEAAFESMRRFTSDASHELRTPLTIVRGAIEVALARDRSGQEYRGTLGDLLEEAERMSKLVDDLLLLARADAGVVELRREPVRLDEVAAEAVEAMKPLAESQGVELSLPGSEPLELAADERWIRQMLYDLLDNAIKYTAPMGRVSISLARREGQALVSISDTGKGIPEDELHRLFERFYRVDKSRSSESGGSGLGLPIAMWIARSHGGDIQVESAIGRGSTFRVVLPLRIRPIDF